MLTKFTEFDVAFGKHVLRIEPDETQDDIEVQLFIDGAKDFVRTHTQRTDEELDASAMARVIVVKMVRDWYYARENNKPEINFERYLGLLRTYNI